MTHWIPAIFALLVAIAGWFYMFYSRAATNLSGIEEPQSNRTRQRLRQLNGLFMLLLAVSFFALFYTAERRESFALLMLAVFVLLALILVLALLDVRFTWKLRQRRNRRGP